MVQECFNTGTAESHETITPCRDLSHLHVADRPARPWMSTLQTVPFDLGGIWYVFYRSNSFPDCPVPSTGE